MIRPLRRFHAWMWLLLTPAMAWVLVAALMGREKFPLADPEPPPAATGEQVLSRNTWSAGSTITTRVLLRGEELVLELTPMQTLKKPDVLVYWLDGQNLSDGYLLGNLSGTQPRYYKLPTSARGRTGSVVLYSLAHQRELDRTGLDLEGVP